MDMNKLGIKLKEWNFEDCTVKEKLNTETLHLFWVLDVDGIVIGVIEPKTVTEMKQIKKEFDNHISPVAECWKDNTGECIYDYRERFENYDIYDANQDEGHYIEDNGMSGKYPGYHLYTVVTEKGRAREICIKD